MRGKHILWALALTLALAPCPSLSQETPEWTFPVPAQALTSDYVTLVNRECLLDAAYEPNDLQTLSLRGTGTHKLRAAAADALSAMFAQAEAEGYKLYVKSSYRSYATQNTMYHNRLQKYGYDDGVVAYPGSSDHQTGLGVDVLNREWMNKEGMTAAFGNTDEAKWMAAHCQEYGFVIRYMQGKEDVTGIIYEPWHLRYVGEEAAAYIMQNGLSLEEFDDIRKEAEAEFSAKYGLSLDEYVKSLFSAKPEVVIGQSEDGDEEVSVFYKP